MKSLCSALLLLPAIAAAQTTPTESTSTGQTIQETVIVKALPPGPSDTPKKPSMQLRLDDYDLQSADFVFPSGLRVIMQEDHSEPLVAITMWVDHGSASDPLGKEGIAHYIEHLWFKSKHGENIPKVWDLLAEMGCDLNASTWLDWTNYMTICSTEFLPVMLKLESLRISDTMRGVTEAEMLTEREVVRNELRLSIDADREFAFYLYGDVFPEGHPYHRPTIGTHESLTAIQLKDITDYVDAYYVPENVTLVVVGDFDREAALSMLIENFDLENIDPRLTEADVFRYPRPGVENPSKSQPEDWYFGVWDPDHRGEEMISFDNPAPRRAVDKAQPPPAPTQQEFVHEAPVPRTQIGVSWAIPGGYTATDAQWGLVSLLLSGEVANYFAEDDRIWEDADGDKDIGCGYWTGTVNGAVMCTASLASSKVDGAKVGWDIVDQVSGIYGFDPTLLERGWGQARMGMMRDVLLGMDEIASLWGRAFLIAEWAHYTGSPTYHSDMISGSREGSVLEAQKMAYDHLKRNRAVISVVHPIPAADVDEDASQTAWHGATRESDSVGQTATDLAKVDAAMVAEETHIPDLGKLKETVFENGLRVWVMPHGEIPIAQARMVFGGGYASDLDGHYTYARTHSIYDVGTNIELDPLQYAADFSSGSGSNYTYMGVMGSAGNLDSSLWILRGAIDSVRPDTSYESQWVKREKGQIIGDWLDDRPGWFVSRITEQHWNPGHPITAVLMPEDYDRLAEFGSADAKATLDRIYQPANATLIIVGKVDPDEATKLAEEYFGGWRARPGTAVGPFGEMPPPNPSTGTRIVVFDDPGRVQTDVELTCQIGPMTASNEMAMVLAGSIMSDRTFRILREELGTTYGARAHVTTWEGGSAQLVLTGEIQNASVGVAVQTYLEIVRDVERGTTDPNLITLEKLERARFYGLRQQSVDQMTGRLATTSRNGLGWLETYPERLAAVDAAGMAQALGGCTDRALITLAGPVDAVKKSLDDAGVTYEVYDWRAEGDALVQQYDPKAWKKELKKRAKKAAEEPQAATSAGTGSTGTP